MNNCCKAIGVKSKNYREAFSILVSLGKSYDGYVFTMKFYTDKTTEGVYICAYDGVKYTNCEPVDATHILCKFQDHGLTCGMLQVDTEMQVPNPLYPTEMQTLATNKLVEVIIDKKRYHLELTTRETDLINTPESAIDLLGNVIKGRPATIVHQEFDEVGNTLLTWNNGVVTVVLRGDPGQISPEQIIELADRIMSVYTLEKLGLVIDTENNLMTYKGHTYELKEHATVVSIEFFDPEVTVHVPDAEAAGGVVQIFASYRQLKRTNYSDGTHYDEWIEDGGVVTYLVDGVASVDGKITVAPSTIETRHKIATATVVVTMNEKAGTANQDVYQKAYVAPADNYDFYLGYLNAKVSSFYGLSTQELIAASTKKSTNKTYNSSQSVGNTCVFMLIPISHNHLTLTKFQYTSSGITTDILHADMWNLNHPDVEIDGVTYKVYGYRNGALTPEDPMTYDYQVTYNK